MFLVFYILFIAFYSSIQYIQPFFLLSYYLVRYLYASVTEQYNLELAKEVISLAGKVTAGPRVWWKVMAAYHWVDDTVHNACKESMGLLFTFICKFL